MKKLSFKIWLLIIILALSLLSIFASSNGFTLFQKGILITSVEQNSSAFEAGLRQGQIITAIDGKAINNITDYSIYIEKTFPSPTDVKTIITTKKSKSVIILYSNGAPNITISTIPKTNLKAGLDLAGGARALVRAENKTLSSAEINDLVSITLNRFNVYGLSDIKVRPVSDLSGNRFMLIEIAGATPKDLRSMIENQGKFEAKIGNQTVFVGGKENGIADVGRNAQNSGITGCETSSVGYVCKFQFSVTLKPEAAKLHANITSGIDVNASNPEYLSKPLDLYVDDVLLESLLISKDLKGQVTTQISISGSGSGTTEKEAEDAANADMHKLQTILITGSLPYKLEIVKLDTISPLLGQNFVKYIMLAGIAALLSASLIIFIRYRKLKQALTVILISFSEIIIILGVAALIDWNLDLASIAGILASIGTGFDDQIVILDESLHKTSQSLKQKIKMAFAIIMGAYFTVLVSLLPLMWAGAGLLKGFAITTIIGISVGVFITRPAFADIVKRMGE